MDLGGGLTGRVRRVAAAIEILTAAARTITFVIGKYRRLCRLAPPSTL